MSLLLIAFFFAAVMGLILLAGWIYLRKEAAADPAAAGTAEGSWVVAHWVEFLRSALEDVGRLIAKPGTEPDSLRGSLFRAGYRSPSAPAVFHGFQVASALSLGAAMLVAAAATGRDLIETIVPAVCGIGFGFLLPPRILEYQVRNRIRRIRTAVASALDLLVLALEAGQSLDQALMDTASALRSIYPDLASELHFCNLEMRAGTPRPEALRRLGERSGEDEMKKLTAVLIDGERFGVSLGPALRTHSRYLRTRMRQHAQESARKLTVKLVMPVFFLIFPAVLLVTLGPAYLQLRQFLDGFLKL